MLDTLSHPVEIQTTIALLRKFTNNRWLTVSVFAKCRKKNENTFLPKLAIVLTVFFF